MYTGACCYSCCRGDGASCIQGHVVTVVVGETGLVVYRGCCYSCCRGDGASCIQGHVVTAVVGEMGLVVYRGMLLQLL